MIVNLLFAVCVCGIVYGIGALLKDIFVWINE